MHSPFKKGRLINWHFVGPVIVYAPAAIAMAVAAVHFVHLAGHVGVMPANAVNTSPNDELARELAHCQALGARAENDLECIAAWAENRRRFFNGGSTAGHRSVMPAKSNEAAQP